MLPWLAAVKHYPCKKTPSKKTQNIKLLCNKAVYKVIDPRTGQLDMPRGKYAKKVQLQSAPEINFPMINFIFESLTWASWFGNFCCVDNILAIWNEKIKTFLQNSYSIVNSIQYFPYKLFSLFTLSKILKRKHLIKRKQEYWKLETTFKNFKILIKESYVASLKKKRIISYSWWRELIVCRVIEKVPLFRICGMDSFASFIIKGFVMERVNNGVATQYCPNSSIVRRKDSCGFSTLFCNYYEYFYFEFNI